MPVFHKITHAPQVGQHWWSVIDAGDWLGAIVNGASILFAILIAVYFTPKLNDKKSRRDAQERLLRILINTWLTPANADYQSSIALLPLDFKGCSKVLNAREELLLVVNQMAPTETSEVSQHFETTRQKQAALIATVANEVGYDISAESLMTGAYVTQGFVDREALLINAMIAWPRIATALERSNELFGPAQSDQPSSQAGDTKWEASRQGA